MLHALWWHCGDIVVFGSGAIDNRGGCLFLSLRRFFLTLLVTYWAFLSSLLTGSVSLRLSDLVHS